MLGAPPPRVLTSALVALVWVAGCDADGSRDASPGTRHPVESALLSASSGTEVNRIRSTSEAELPKFLTSFARFDDERAVGAASASEGNGGMVLGELLDALVLDLGGGQERVAVLDKNFGVVRIFDQSGAPDTTLGGFGDGPGEISHPQSLSYSDGIIGILDGFRELERFTYESGQWRFIDRMDLPLTARDVCLGRDGLFALGIKPEDVAGEGGAMDARLLHAMDPEGQILSSFGDVYATDQRIVLSSIGQGTLACDARGSRVFVGFSMLHEVHAYTRDGDLSWITTLDHLSYPDLVEFGEGGIGSDPSSSETNDLVRSVSLISDTVLAVQVESRSMDDLAAGIDRTEFETVYLDSRTGRLLGAHEGGHRIIGGGEGIAILYTEDPFPEFALVRTLEEQG